MLFVKGKEGLVRRFVRGIRGTRSITCAVVALSLLGGCSKGDPLPPEAPPVTTSGESESPSPAVTEPPLPSAATTHDQAGAEAFVRHWFDLANYAQQTGHTQPLRLVSEPECDVCSDLADKIDKAYRGGGRIEGRLFAVSQVVSPDVEQDRSTATTVTFEQQEGVTVSADGTRTPREPVPTQVLGPVIDFEDDHWVMVGIGTL